MLIGIIQLCSHSEPSHRSRVVRRKAHDIMASALRLKAGGSSLRLLGKILGSDKALTSERVHS